MTQLPLSQAVLELLQLAEMAKQSPWTSLPWSRMHGHDENDGHYVEQLESGETVSGYTKYGISKADADFIAFARNFAEQYKDELRGIAEGDPIGWCVAIDGKIVAAPYLTKEEALSEGEAGWCGWGFMPLYAHPPTIKPDDGCYINREDAEPTREQWAAMGDALMKLRREHGTLDLHHDLIADTVIKAFKQ